jgi:hypothetical protein
MRRRWSRTRVVAITDRGGSGRFSHLRDEVAVPRASDGVQCPRHRGPLFRDPDGRRHRTAQLSAAASHGGDNFPHRTETVADSDSDNTQ